MSTRTRGPSCTWPGRRTDGFLPPPAWMAMSASGKVPAGNCCTPSLMDWQSGGSAGRQIAHASPPSPPNRFTCGHSIPQWRQRPDQVDLSRVFVAVGIPQNLCGRGPTGVFEVENMVPFEQIPLSAFNTASLAEAALAYAAAGIAVFPLKPQDKRPIVPHGFYSATTDRSLIRRWWRSEPRANIGVVCGAPSGWWVIDIDPRHHGLASLEQLQRDLDRDATHGSPSSLLSLTRRQLTGGGGAHLVFRERTDVQVRVRSATNFAGYQGIDLRGNRSYIAVAPSVHPSGGVYQWQNEQPLVLFPDALLTRWLA